MIVTAPEKAKKSVHIETWGCQMNIADSERMLQNLDEEYVLSERPEDADVIILNTCHIREKAKHKVLSRLGVLKELKKENQDLVIAVAGCVAQAEGKKLLEQAPTVDVLLGPGKIDEISSLLQKQREEGRPQVSIGFDTHRHEDEEIKPILEQPLFGRNHISRFINIQQGCNNFCTFCVVPFTRGREKSESAQSIETQAKALIASGTKEITLLGQNVNSYGLDLAQSSENAFSPFTMLLQKIAALDGLESLRFTTSNPHDLDRPLCELFAREPKLGRYFHLPVQSGSDRILASMRRKVTVAEYLEKISWLRAAVSDMAISTDLIVGFPGETDDDFQGTLDLVEQVQYSFIYAFQYSPRKGTAAIRFTTQVDEAVKSMRLAELNRLQDRITLEQHQRQIGRELEVLFLYESQKEPGIFYGRCPYFRLVRVESKQDIAGKKLGVKIIDSNKTALSGILL